MNLSWQGTIQLHYDYQDAKTRLASVWQQAPLKVQRSLYPESEAVCHTILIHTAGGMVAGDRLIYDITLAPQSQVVVTTAAASKVYRASVQTDGPTTEQIMTEQIIDLHLEPGSWLDWLPQETILFNQAQFKQRLRVNLAPGAHWLGWDIYRFGRTARGERFLSGQWRSHTEVWQAGQPLWIDRQRLIGGAHILDHPHGLNQGSVVGTLVWLGQPVERNFVNGLRSHWTEGTYPGEAGVTRLQQGLVCRYRGNSTAEARQWFTQVWNDVRSYALGKPACIPRVWQL